MRQRTGRTTTRLNPNGGGDGNGSAPNSRVRLSRKMTSTPRSARIGLVMLAPGRISGLTVSASTSQPSTPRITSTASSASQYGPSSRGQTSGVRIGDTDERTGRGPFADREVDHRCRPQDQQIGERHQCVDAARRGGADDQLQQICHRPLAVRQATDAEAHLARPISASWPGLSRPSTPFYQEPCLRVDARDKPAHDGARLDSSGETCATSGPRNHRPCWLSLMMRTTAPCGSKPVRLPSRNPQDVPLAPIAPTKFVVDCHCGAQLLLVERTGLFRSPAQSAGCRPSHKPAGCSAARCIP